MAFDNSPDYRYRRVTEDPWDFSYLALSAVYDGITAINGGVEIGGAGGPDNNRALAFAKLVQGIAHGYLALLFDSAYVLDETVNLADPITLLPYPDIMTAAIGYFDAAIALTGSSFTLPMDWINGNSLTNTQIAQLAHSYRARFLSQVGRTPAERANANWAQILADAAAGITQDLAIEGDGDPNWFWFKALEYYGARDGWTRVDYKTLGWTELGTVGGYDNWLASEVVDRVEFELNVPDGRIMPSGEPQGVGLDFQYVGTSPFYDNRGNYHDSYYQHHRYSDYYNNGGVGPMQHMTVTEMDLIAAEGHLRTGNNASAVAIINTTRARGGLPAATAGDPDLFEKLMYEKRIETFALCSGCAFFDRRGFGPLSASGHLHHQGLVEGTPLHFAPPGSVLEDLEIPLYTYGGVGNEGTPLVLAPLAGPGAGQTGGRTITAFDIYAFRDDPNMTVAEKLAILDRPPERPDEQQRN